MKSQGKFSAAGEFPSRAPEELRLRDRDCPGGLHPQAQDHPEEDERLHRQEHKQPDQGHVQAARVARQQGDSKHQSVFNVLLVLLLRLFCQMPCISMAHGSMSFCLTPLIQEQKKCCF